MLANAVPRYLGSPPRLDWTMRPATLAPDWDVIKATSGRPGKATAGGRTDPRVTGLGNGYTRQGGKAGGVELLVRRCCYRKVLDGSLRRSSGVFMRKKRENQADRA